VPTRVKYFRDELVPAKAGQKPFGPTADERRLVEMLAAKGLRYVDMASVLRGGINPCMLWKHFRTEMRRGKAVANLKIADTLYKKVTVNTGILNASRLTGGWRKLFNPTSAGQRQVGELSRNRPPVLEPLIDTSKWTIKTYGEPT